MRAVGFEQPGGPEVLRVLEVAEPVESSDTVLVDVVAASVNPVDVATRSGQIPVSTMPTLLGWDFSGVIRSTVASCDLAVGDEVMALTAPLGTGIASMSEQIRLDPALLVRVPRGVSLHHAAGLPLVGVTAAQTVRAADLRATDSVLLIGAQGGVGSHIAARLIHGHAERVDVLVRDRDQPTWATRLPAPGRVFTDPESVPQAEYDVVIDAGGVPDLMSALVAGGRFLTITPFSAPDCAGRPEGAVQIVGVELDRADLADVAEGVAAGWLSLPEPTVMGFSDATRAHEMIESGGHRGKIVLTP